MDAFSRDVTGDVLRPRIIPNKWLLFFISLLIYYKSLYYKCKINVENTVTAC